jgi:hypothetical protein
MYMKGVVWSSDLEEVRKCKNAHSPTLETVIMVEETIKKLGACTITELYKALPRTVVYPTLRLIVSYFYAKGFIIADKEGKIVWIYNPKLVEKYKSKPNLMVR